MNAEYSTNETSLSHLLVGLLKGVIYRDENLTRWQRLLQLQNRIRDYFAQIGLELALFEDDGFAYLKNRTVTEGEEEIPRLITRRQLPYAVSLTLALLRRKLAEHDAKSGEERLILDREEIVELVATFLPSGSNEARTADRIGQAINRIAELGFIRFLKGQEEKIEVKRLLTAFVDAQWLSDFDRNLAAYASHAEENPIGGETTSNE